MDIDIRTRKAARILHRLLFRNTDRKLASTISIGASKEAARDKSLVKTISFSSIFFWEKIDQNDSLEPLLIGSATDYISRKKLACIFSCPAPNPHSYSPTSFANPLSTINLLFDVSPEKIHLSKNFPNVSNVSFDFQF